MSRLVITAEYQDRTASECSEIAQLKGFDATTWDNFATKTMLVVTEVHEAIDAVHADGQLPGTVDPELADVAIRTLTMLHELAPPEGWAPFQFTVQGWHLYQPIEEHLWPVVEQLCLAVEAWRKGQYTDARDYLRNVVQVTFQAADTLGVDLQRAIAEKLAKNRTRPTLHGKQRSDG